MSEKPRRSIRICRLADEKLASRICHSSRPEAVDGQTEITGKTQLIGNSDRMAGNAAAAMQPDDRRKWPSAIRLCKISGEPSRLRVFGNVVKLDKRARPRRLGS